MVGFDQIEEHYGSKGLGIVGYFHANERFEDAELGIVAKNIGDHICRYFPQAAIFLVCILIVLVIPSLIYFLLVTSQVCVCL